VGRGASMYPFNEAPNPELTPAFVLACAVIVGVWKRRMSLLSATTVSAAISATATIGYEMLIRGFGPLFPIGLGLSFLVFLPMSFVTILISRLAMHRAGTGWPFGPQP